MEQLTLPISTLGDPSFATFVTADNGPAVASLRDPDEPMVYLWGGRGSGKSHLLKALIGERRQQQTLIIDLAQGAELDPALLDGLERLDWVGIDNLDAVAGQARWEEALFDLFNRTHAAATRLRVCAGVAPAALPLCLEDLRSRLGWGPVYRLHPLDDAGKAAALVSHAKGCGLVLPEEVQRFLLRRASRDNHALLSMLKRLDDGSLAQQRHLTVPFVKQILGL